MWMNARFVLRRRWFPAPLALMVLSLGVAPRSSPSSQAHGAVIRQVGVDVSEWQLNIDWSQVAASGKSFAFIRSTRGGTTGSSGGGGTNTVGNGRYDDPNFVGNITAAKNAGLWVAPYHYGRADIATSDPVDEANHFLDIAGPYMTAGYLRPVLDLEAGNQLSTSALTTWALRFTNTVAAAKGEAARPIIYMNRNYANVEIDGTTTVGGKKITDHPLWLADPDTFNYTTNKTVDPLTDPTPPGFYLGAVTSPIYPNPLGPWGVDTGALPKTWSFWQYSLGGGTVPGIPVGVDLDVYHSELGPISMFAIPEPASAVATFALVSLALGARRRRPRR
jgi:GH25 family lysozyme M1 (1,4-beta-N-acetylmuramidase)